MKRIVLLCLALLIALSATGAGYAMWDKELLIDGTVNTGEVDAYFTTAWTVEDPEVEDKDVGECLVTGIEAQTLAVTLNNAYPCYGCTVAFTVDNIGTIPVKVNAIEYSLDGGTTWVPWNSTVEITVELPFGLGKFVVAILHMHGIYVGDQIEDGESLPGSLYIHVEQESDELGTGTFMVRVHLVQWNEYPYL